MSQNVGGRENWSGWGFVLGFLGGAALVLPLAIYDWYRFGMYFFLAAGLSGTVAQAVAHARTSFPGAGRGIAWGGLKGAGAGYVAGVHIAFVIWLCVGWARGYDLGMAAMIIIVCTLNGTAFGLALGVNAASKAERERQLALTKHLADIDAHRTALKSAIEQRFGPLDESRCEAIRTWDADRLTEARRKLDGASRVEELDP